MRQVASIAVVVLLLIGSISRASVTAQETSLLDLLPVADDIGPAFVAVDQRTRTLGEQATGFANPDEAARLLTDWAWQDNAFLVFQSTELTATGAPVATLDISLTRFASTADAATAMPYFLGDRAAILGQREEQSQNLSQQTIGDEMRVVTGDVEGGYDTTLYARSGPLLLRISATSLSGEGPSPEAIARGIIDRFAGQSPPVTISQRAESSLSLFGVETLPLDNAACFRVAGEGELDLATVAERLATGSGVAATLDELGWEEGAYRQFACEPAPGRAGWIDLSVHRFPDDASATDAVTVFADTRSRGMDLRQEAVNELGDGDAALAGPAVNGTEYTRYVSSGPLLFAITGVAPVGDPRSDVETIAAALVELPVNETGAVAAVATSTPYVLGEAAPTVAVPPTTTPIPPTAIPLPTSTLVPTATFVPAPTATAVPIATAVPTEPQPPTTIPIQVPTAAPTEVPSQPTPTAGPLPTATPRVIHLPTPGVG